MRLLLAGKPRRVVWHMPRGAFALERAGELVAIGWLWSLEQRYRPGDVVLVGPTLLAELQSADLPAAA